MAETKHHDLTQKIQAPGFQRTDPAVAALSDPIADTPMVVTLDELRTYESDPRVTRNPKYDELKVSIRERGLDAPPPITRRPGQAKYIIRNGGNTRLSILRELWSETKDERFFRIRCLFRPWPTRGEIVVLTGHLAENDLHGALTFIERALAVEKARLLYETDGDGSALSQSELARRLTGDGYPVTQSQISRMQDAIRHVLPAIPSALYGGLGRDQIERITALRKAAARVHAQHAASEQSPSAFSGLFQDVLSQFDGPPENFNIQRVRDELLGQLSSLLGIEYDSLAVEVVDAETRAPPVPREEMFHVKPFASDNTAIDQQSTPRTNEVTPVSPAPTRQTAPAPHATAGNKRTSSVAPAPDGHSDGRAPDAVHSDSARSQRPDSHNVANPELQPSNRVDAIRRLVANATGVPIEDPQSPPPPTVPLAAGGPHPVSELWDIDPSLNSLEHLRLHTARLAAEIAEEAGCAEHVDAVEDGIGFTCGSVPAGASDAMRSRASLMLLSAFSLRFLERPTRPATHDVRLVEYLTALLIGERVSHRLSSLRFSDANLVKLFRLIRLSRRILELQSQTAAPAAGNASDVS